MQNQPEDPFECVSQWTNDILSFLNRLTVLSTARSALWIMTAERWITRYMVH